MKVYIAAPYAARDALRPYAAELELIGMPVTSRWLKEQHDTATGGGAATPLPDDQVRVHVDHDFRDIDTADTLVLFTAAAAADLLEAGTEARGRLHSGGRHVETGYALARHKRVIVIGEPECIFHRAARVQIVPNWHAAVLELCKLERSNNYAVAAEVAL